MNDFTEALGYFDDPAVAYVQTPQAYSNQSGKPRPRAEPRRRLTAITHTYKWRRSGRDSPSLQVVITGSECALLREAGGFPDHAAEDILLTVRYQGLGWRGVYLPRIFFEGLAPSTWAAYVTQQIRWARSVADVKIRHFRKAGSQSFVARTLNILQGFGYFQDAIVASLGVGSLGVMLAGGGGMRDTSRERRSGIWRLLRRRFWVPITSSNVSTLRPGEKPDCTGVPATSGLLNGLARCLLCGRPFETVVLDMRSRRKSEQQPKKRLVASSLCDLHMVNGRLFDAVIIAIAPNMAHVGCGGRGSILYFDDHC